MQMFKGRELGRRAFTGAVALALAAAGCGAAGEETESGETSPGSVQEALMPSWSFSTSGVSLISWYDAGTRTTNGTGNVTSWPDQLSGVNNVSNTGTQGPTVNANAFGTGKPGLVFSGTQLLRNTSWSGLAPSGTSTPYTVLMIATGISQQTSSAVAWWSPTNYDAVRCQIVPNASGNVFLQGSRGYTLSGDQVFTGTTNVSNTAHALGWLYTPEVLRTFVDGTTQSSSTLTALPSISPSTFLIGARSDLPTELFTGTIAQIYVFKGNLGSSDLANFYAYAKSNWNVP